MALVRRPNVWKEWQWLWEADMLLPPALELPSSRVLRKKLNSLRLRFLIWKVGRLLEPPHRVVTDIQWINTEQIFDQVSSVLLHVTFIVIHVSVCYYSNTHSHSLGLSLPICTTRRVDWKGSELPSCAEVLTESLPSNSASPREASPPFPLPPRHTAGTPK